MYNKTALVEVSKPNKITLGNKILFSLYPEKYNQNFEHDSLQCLMFGGCYFGRHSVTPAACSFPLLLKHTLQKDDESEHAVH